MKLPPGTILESDDEVQPEQDANRVLAQERFVALGIADESNGSVEHLFQPRARPPIASLLIYDDGQKTGEIIRLRQDKFTIGRSEGDLVLPDDEQISKRHVSLNRQLVSGQYRWVVTDLESRNGLFVRVSRAPLRNHAELLIGSGRYRFEVIQRDREYRTIGLSEAVSPVNGFQTNVRRQRGLPFGTEVLTEILPGGMGSQMVLGDGEYWIGSDPRCEVSRVGDLLTKGHHAKLVRGSHGIWSIQNQKSLNGVWLKMPQVSLQEGQSCHFQIGEQRFKFKFGEASSRQPIHDGVPKM
jgi:pSer/pThr/pTyr-binding forkhead associated (FHA) protein